MAGVIVEKYQQTKALVQEQLTSTRDGIVQKKDEIVDRGRKLRNDLERRREMAVGRLRDESLERLYGASESAYRGVAQLIERVEQLTPGKLNLVKGRSKVFLARAEHFNEARDGLNRPDIAGYDELNVAQVKDALGDLTAYELEKIRAYEEGNKNRVTILREIERLTAN